jgi:hypothetical protein
MRTLIAAVFCLCSISAYAEAVYPTAISDKYANEKPDTARQRTCVDQYMANKATDSNGGLVWQHQGGGYYAECKRRLPLASDKKKKPGENKRARK